MAPKRKFKNESDSEFDGDTPSKVINAVKMMEQRMRRSPIPFFKSISPTIQGQNIPVSHESMDAQKHHGLQMNTMLEIVYPDSKPSKITDIIRIKDLLNNPDSKVASIHNVSWNKFYTNIESSRFYIPGVHAIYGLLESSPDGKLFPIHGEQRFRRYIEIMMEKKSCGDTIQFGCIQKGTW